MGVVVSVGAGTRTEQTTAYQQTEQADVATLVEELRVARPWLVSRVDVAACGGPASLSARWTRSDRVILRRPSGRRQ
jgi:hypothetical protein